MNLSFNNIVLIINSGIKLFSLVLDGINADDYQLQ